MIHLAMCRHFLKLISKLKLLEILSDPPKKRKLKIELAMTIDAGKSFVRATYRLEGDGPLIFSAYDEIKALEAGIHSQYYPNTNAVAKKLSSDSTRQQQLIEYGKACVKTAWNTFIKSFRMISRHHSRSSSSLSTLILQKCTISIQLPLILRTSSLTGGRNMRWTYRIGREHVRSFCSFSHLQRQQNDCFHSYQTVFVIDRPAVWKTISKHWLCCSITLNRLYFLSHIMYCPLIFVRIM